VRDGSFSAMNNHDNHAEPRRDERDVGPPGNIPHTLVVALTLKLRDYVARYVELP
jgi:hypothetical protein